VRGDVAAGGERAAAVTEYVRASSAITEQTWKNSLPDERPLTRAVATASGASLDEARAAVGRLIEGDAESHRLDTEMWHLLVPADAAAPAHLVERATPFLSKGVR
jgi:hypothetical protein